MKEWNIFSFCFPIEVGFKSDKVYLIFFNSTISFLNLTATVELTKKKPASDSPDKVNVSENNPHEKWRMSTPPWSSAQSGWGLSPGPQEVALGVS